MPASDASVAQYNARIRVLRTALGVEEGDLKFLNRPKSVIQVIENMKDASVNTRKAFYIAIVATLKTLKRGPTKALETYRAKQLEYNNAVSEQYNKQELSPSEVEKFVSWTDILAVREKMKEATAFNTYSKMYQDYVLVCLYTYLPPARLDYGALKIVDKLPEKLTDNYYVTGTPEIVLSQYKTVNKYGVHHIKIPNELAQILDKFIQILPEPVNYLLMNSNNELMSEASLSKNLTRIFMKYTGKKVSVNILRHSYVTHHMAGQKTKKELDEFASGMMHSTAMDVIYRKLT